MHEDRLEADLRAALHREMALARLGVAAPQIRAGIAARERSRRWARAATGIAAALAVILVLPLLPPLAQRTLAPDQPTETAVTVRIEAAGDLVVEKVPFAGPPVEIARLPRAAELLRPTVDPARLQPGTMGTAIAFHPDGYLAVAVSAADSQGSPVAVLVWNLARSNDEPTRIDATADIVGSPLIGWTPDGRLVVADGNAVSKLDVLDARTGRVVSVTLPDHTVVADVRWAGGSVAVGSIASTPDGEVVVTILDRTNFRSTIATADLPRSGGAATLTEGLPRAVWSVTGLDRPWGVKAGVVGALGNSSGFSTAGVRVDGQAAHDFGPPDAQTWAVFGPREQLVGRPAWDATVTGIWLLQGTGRRLDLVHLDGPGLAATRATLPWDGTTGSDRNAIAGLGSDGRGLIVRQATGDLFVDGVSGRVAELSAGARFVGWAHAATTTTPEERPFCASVENTDLAGSRIAGPGEPFVEGLAAGMGGAADASPRPAADASGLPAAHAAVGAGLRLLLPDGACASVVAAEAVPVNDPAATPLKIDSSAVTPGGPGGELGLAEPPQGRWIVRVRLAVAGGTGSSVASLLYRVDVAAGAPSPSGGASPGGRLVFDAPPTWPLPGSAAGPGLVVPVWTVQHGGADAPADGVSTFGDPASPALRAGPVVASVACTGEGSILVAATTAASPGPAASPAADRWTRVVCAGVPRDAEPVSVNLPDARGGETVLFVDRRPTRADDLLGYSVVVGQPIDVACDAPTPALVARIGLRSSPDGSSQTGILGAYKLQAGSLATQPGELAGVAALPALTGSPGGLDGPWSLALPAGLCATGWSVQLADAGTTELSSNSSSWTSDNPVEGQMLVTLQDVGEWVVSVTLTLPGPDGVTGSATLLWHVRVLGPATPAP